MSALERVRVVPDPGVRARISPELVALGLVGILTIAVLLPPVMPRLSFGAAVEATPSPPPACSHGRTRERSESASRPTTRISERSPTGPLRQRSPTFLSTAARPRTWWQPWHAELHSTRS